MDMIHRKLQVRRTHSMVTAKVPNKFSKQNSVKTKDFRLCVKNCDRHSR